MLDNFEFGNIKSMISAVSALIKEFTNILKAFVASWKKVPAAAATDNEGNPIVDVEDPYAE